MILTPLASGCSHPLPDGEWRCHSLFSQAINLQHEDGTLLTLLRGGTSLPPMGWLLRCQEYDYLRSILSPGTVLTLFSGVLHWRALRLRAPRRHATPSLPTHPLQPLAAFLSAYPQKTGLCGSLSAAVLRTDAPQQRLFKLLDNGFADAETLIGLGPGLTPSMDDMLVGALAVLYCATPLRELPRKIKQLPPARTLQQLTTTVSACYLLHASQGRFSTTLIHLLRHLAVGAHSTRTHHAIRHLLAHGHTSGADTLLGVHVAQQCLVTHVSGGYCNDGP
ncbi:DUF2877 domain-containing protein [Raoultella terrigena]|uniref:DUF2877 domain-containing protein n=1 Tax=Raoultella terrigena TaxID=577 RepID=UPI0009759806|nr:DUF2877 domain-containing protein [Raoultella terrigena]OMP92085.1 hypothetical protein BZP36_18220 [Raoultella terrigena]